MRRSAIILSLFLVCIPVPAREDGASVSGRADTESGTGRATDNAGNCIGNVLAGGHRYSPSNVEFFVRACRTLGFIPAIFATADRITRNTRIGTASNYHPRGADGLIHEGPEAYRIE